MNLPFHKKTLPASRKFLFPLFSLLFHIVLFLFFMNMNTVHAPPEIKDEDIVAMIDLNELRSQPKPPEPPPVIETPPVPQESSPEDETGDTEENTSPEPEPVLDPALDEALEDESEEVGLSVPVETAQNILPRPLPPAPEPELPDPPIPESAETEAPEAEPVSETELPAEETAASEAAPVSPEPVSAAPPPESEAAPPEPASVAPVVPDPPSAQEVAKASELQDPPKVKTEKKVAAAIKKNFQPPKPSKEKVKKSGLLGLLGNKKRDRPSKNPRFAKNLKQPGRKLPAGRPQADALPAESRQKMARLKNKLLKAEQKRLMTKKSIGRKKKSRLKIVQGSGRNFGVISSAIAQEEWRLTHVYNRLLQENPGLQGNLIIEFTISPKGKVIKSHILTSSFSNARFEKALIQAIRLWKFPAAKEGETTILYPLAFSPSG